MLRSAVLVPALRDSGLTHGLDARSCRMESWTSALPSAAAAIWFCSSTMVLCATESCSLSSSTVPESLLKQCSVSRQCGTLGRSQNILQCCLRRQSKPHDTVEAILARPLLIDRRMTRLLDRAVQELRQLIVTQPHLRHAAPPVQGNSASSCWTTHRGADGPSRSLAVPLTSLAGLNHRQADRTAILSRRELEFPCRREPDSCG